MGAARNVAASPTTCATPSPHVAHAWHQIPLESLALVDISTGQVRIAEENEPQTEEERRIEQEELDRLLDANGRISLDITIGASEDTSGPEELEEPPPL